MKAARLYASRRWRVSRQCDYDKGSGRVRGGREADRGAIGRAGLAGRRRHSAAFRGDRAAAPRRAAGVRFAPFGLALSERVPRRLAARPADAAPLRGRVRRRAVPALRGARRAFAAGALSRAPFSTSIASRSNSTRACSTGRFPTSPTPARCGWRPGSGRSRASSATPSRSIAAACRSPRRWRASPPCIVPITSGWRD